MHIECYVSSSKMVLPTIHFVLRSTINLLGLSEFGNLFLDSHLQPRSEFWSIAKEEQNFHPDEEGRQEKRLYEIIEQGGSSSLKRSVADELCQPADDVKTERPVVGSGAVGRGQMVAVGGSGEE